MPTLLESGGSVGLWGGWSVVLPAAYHQRNEDGSWSAWGKDWAVDVHIIEVGGDSNGQPVRAEDMFGAGRQINVRGANWIGSTELLEERDAVSGEMVTRLAARLAAVNTVMSFWVGYKSELSGALAVALVNGVTHEQADA